MSQDLFLQTWQYFLSVMYLNPGKSSEMGPTSTKLWFEEAIPIVVQNGTFFLVQDSDFKRDVILRRYVSKIETHFSEAYGSKVTLCLLNEHDAMNFSFYAEHRDAYVERAKQAYQAAVQKEEEAGAFDLRPFFDPYAQTTQSEPTLSSEAVQSEPEGNASDLLKESPFGQAESISTGSAFSQEVPKEAVMTSSEPLVAGYHNGYVVEESFSPEAVFVPSFPKQEVVAPPPMPDFAALSNTATPLRFSDETNNLSTTDENGNHLDFEHFVVGNSNKFAHAACLAVAREPARQYNPLFIYGQSGLGKTHLLKSIIRYLQLHHPDLKIRYVKGDEFTNQMIESLSFHRTEQFRENYRKVDVLLIDDIQFIAGKESTQEEFFHTFNALYEDQKQIILTSDRPPKDIPRLEERLRTRFEWGLTADIQPPDLELRVAILKNKCTDYGISVSPEILAVIAENLRNNVRQLEGAVKKIAAQTLLLGQQVTKELALSCISDFMSASEPVALTADKILSQIAERYEISVEDLKGAKRTKQIAMPRHIAIYLIREMTNMSFPQLGRLFGRDHTTILNSYQTIEEKMKTDPFFEGEIKEFLRELQGN